MNDDEEDLPRSSVALTGRVRQRHGGQDLAIAGTRPSLIAGHA
jgi:hypothetical protein